MINICRLEQRCFRTTRHGRFTHGALGSVQNLTKQQPQASKIVESNTEPLRIWPVPIFTQQAQLHDQLDKWECG